MVPKHKHDLEAVARLEALSVDQLVPLIPSLLEWLQDLNWPVAKGVAQVLIPCGAQLVPHIQAVMRTDDHIWKYWCLTELIEHLPSGLVAETFSPELKRIAASPTRSEQAEDLDEAAQQLLQKWGVT